MSYLVLVINPGSTTTKIALFRDQDRVFYEEITHQASELAMFPEVNDQFDYRKDLIVNTLKSHSVDIRDIDIFAARGGGLTSLDSGTYPVNDMILYHTKIGFAGKHPCILAARIAHEFAKEAGGVAFVVDPPGVDEFDDIARVTGFHEVWRDCHTHALNQKAVAKRCAADLKKSYKECNFIVAHLGGGVTITAHSNGRMIESTDIMNGNGPMAPTRAGTLSVKTVIDLCFSGEYTKDALYKRLTKTGGLIDHLGTSDLREVRKRISSGDRYAELIYDAMIYQFAKHIGMMAAVLKGTVDAIILTGGMTNDEILVEDLNKYVSWISPLMVYPGEFEMEALAEGALRVMRGEETPKEYSGEPNWRQPNRTY